MICPKCNGVGRIPFGEEPEIFSEEEWLRSATFEELAGAIYEWYSQGHIEGKNKKLLSSVTRVVEWLKQPHKE
ncbi:hypothetical protein SAMN04487864_11553 [Succiniclasticum ruminis]|uniref:Uncharacterized protein n=1 Tax=Succiniclasticum ruminis TaxID=40841 RepID=A0A1G6NQN3_9FIRM|nr:hypothetical protein [Succiniclasticum ruminis]SDC70193.1 hypothetical protein SAMN04487864_11553 [Succiniclasticum ruminis]